MIEDKNFEKILELLFGLEGGYSNRKSDLGGPTNLGVTQATFNAWRKMNNQPLGSVKTDLTKEEARNIYYNMFWKESGADKYTDPRDAMALFDMAVNSGPAEAKRIFKESNENFYTMLDNRRKYFDDIVRQHIGTTKDQSENIEGWYNRLTKLENNANKMIQDGFYTPPYYNEITPFDEGYKGNLKPVGDIPDREAKRNKYQYNRNKAIERGHIKNLSIDNFSPDYKSQNGYNIARNGEPYFKRSLEDLAPWELDELLQRYI